MSDKIMIREYATQDKKEVLHLFRLNIPMYFGAEEEIEFIKYLETGRELYYVLLFEQIIVGCGGIHFADEGTTGKICWDIIHPEYQGKSLGTQLLKFRMKKLHDMPTIRKINVRTSQVVYKFYENNGFELIEIVKDYWANGFDMYLMIYKKK
ncbi:MAG: GNAT family N-acetyltransferase [Saprospiraceae bacterium]